MLFNTQTVLSLLACTSTFLNLGAAAPLTDVGSTDITPRSELHPIEARALKMKKWKSKEDDAHQTPWKAFVASPLFPPDNWKEMTQSYAKQGYDILQDKNDIKTHQDNLLVACLYIPNKGYHISSQAVGGFTPDKSKAPDWAHAVGSRSVFHAEDLTCYLYESQLKTPLAPNTDYPRGSYIYIWGRFGKDAEARKVDPCSSGATIDPSCHQVLAHLRIASDDNPNP